MDEDTYSEGYHPGGSKGGGRNGAGGDAGCGELAPGPDGGPQTIPETMVTTLTGHTSEVFICAWSPTAPMLATGYVTPRTPHSPALTDSAPRAAPVPPRMAPVRHPHTPPHHRAQLRGDVAEHRGGDTGYFASGACSLGLNTPSQAHHTTATGCSLPVSLRAQMWEPPQLLSLASTTVTRVGFAGGEGFQSTQPMCEGRQG
jgi:hypothetical protein